MRAMLGVALMLSGWTAGAGGQVLERTACAAPMEYDPVLVANPEQRVTFVCERATALELLVSAGQQARMPLGVVAGRAAGRLSHRRRRYDLRDVPVREAVGVALRGTGYTMHEEDGVLVLVAGDLSLRQRVVLQHRFPEFGGASAASLTILGQRLTMWVRSLVPGACGFAGGGLSSTNELEYPLPVMKDATTEQIANRIVRLGPKGMWTLEASGRGPEDCFHDVDTVAVESYQHFSNRPVVATGRPEERGHP